MQPQAIDSGYTFEPRSPTIRYVFIQKPECNSVILLWSVGSTAVRLKLTAIGISSTVTVSSSAPTSTAPLTSVTTPRRRPRTSWAVAVPARPDTKTATHRD